MNRRSLLKSLVAGVLAPVGLPAKSKSEPEESRLILTHPNCCCMLIEYDSMPRLSVPAQKVIREMEAYHLGLQRYLALPSVSLSLLG